MSISTQLTRLAQNVGALNADTNAIFDALRAKGVDVPSGSTLSDVPTLIDRWPRIIYATQFNQIATGQFGAIVGSASIQTNAYEGSEVLDTTFGFSTNFGIFNTKSMTNASTDYLYTMSLDGMDTYSIDYFIKERNSFTGSFISFLFGDFVINIPNNPSLEDLTIGYGFSQSYKNTTTLYNNFVYRDYGFYHNVDILHTSMHHVAAVFTYDSGNLTIKQYVDGVLSLVGTRAVQKPSSVSLGVSGNRGYDCPCVVGRLTVRNYDASINNGANFPIPTTDL